MRRIGHLTTAALICVVTALVLAVSTGAEEGFKPPCPPDKDLCALMIRYGDEAYSRGKYSEAKKYYRMAVAADPSSPKAWALYDRAFLADLAKQVERTGKFIPYVPPGDLEKTVVPKPPPVPAPSAAGPAPKPQGPPSGTGKAPQEVLPSGVVIMDDEGC
jgi:hypothetical protein